MRMPKLDRAHIACIERNFEARQGINSLERRGK